MMKPPFKIKINTINYEVNNFNGKIEFYGKEYEYSIKKSTNENGIQIPFDILDNESKNVLVRISGMNGIYSEEHLDLLGYASSLDIKSSLIFDDILNKYNMFDTIELFFK